MESKLKVSWILIGLLIITMLANHQAIVYKVKLEYVLRTAASVMVVKNRLESLEPETVIIKKDTAQYQEVANKLRQFDTRKLIAKCIPDTYYTFYNANGEEILTTFTLP